MISNHDESLPSVPASPQMASLSHHRDVPDCQAKPHSAQSSPTDETDVAHPFTLSYAFTLPLRLQGMDPLLQDQSADFRSFVLACYEKLEHQELGPLREVGHAASEKKLHITYEKVILRQSETVVKLPLDCLLSEEITHAEIMDNREKFKTSEMARLAAEGEPEPNGAWYSATFLILVTSSDESTAGPSSGSSKHATSDLAVPEHSDIEPKTEASVRGTIPAAIVEKRGARGKDERGRRGKLQEEQEHSDNDSDEAGIATHSFIAEAGARKIAVQLEVPTEDGSTVTKAAGPQEERSNSKRLRGEDDQLRAEENASAPHERNSAGHSTIKKAKTSDVAVPREATQARPLSMVRCRLSDFKHTMHVSSPAAAQTSRNTLPIVDKPRFFFKSSASPDYSGIGVTLHGNIHTWKAGRDADVLIENKRRPSAYAVETGLWSSDHMVAMIGAAKHRETATPGGAEEEAFPSLRLVALQGSNRRGIYARREYHVDEDLAKADSRGLSAMVWTSKSAATYVAAGYGKRNLHFCTLSQGMADEDEIPVFTTERVSGMDTLHSNGIRSLVWRPQSETLVLGGADKRVSVICPVSQQVISEWKEDNAINRAYMLDAHSVLLSLASLKHQFRVVDLRVHERRRESSVFGYDLLKGRPLGQYYHGDIHELRFAYPLNGVVRIWDLRNTTASAPVPSIQDVVQCSFNSRNSMTFLRKEKITDLSIF